MLAYKNNNYQQDFGVIKSPRYNRDDYLHRFVRHRRRCRSRHRRRRRRRPQSLVHAITFEQHFGFLSIWHDCWPWPIDYLIRFWSIFIVTLTLNFEGQIWNLLYLSQKWSNCHKTKANTSIELLASNVTIGFDLGHDFDFEFSRSNIKFAISQPKMVRLPWNEKQTYRLNFRPQMWPSGFTLAMNLPLNFQGQPWNLLYLNQKWSEGGFIMRSFYCVWLNNKI